MFCRVPWRAGSAHRFPSSSFSPHSYPANTWTVVHSVVERLLDSRIPQRFSVVSVTARAACPSAWKCKECPCFLLWCAVNSCFFITHMCGSGTSTNSCFGLVLFSLLIYFWFRDQHRADNNVCMRKWLLAVMRCQTAQCNAKTRSTSIVTLLFTVFQFVFIAMILKISIITDVERQNCCLLCQCMSVTWCKATKAIDSVQIKCINTVFISSSALYRCSYNYRGISVNKVMSKFTQVTWPQNSATYRP